MAAVLADGETIIDNAALEPEITDLGNFLIALGAEISGLDSKTIRITGVKKLKGCSYTAIGDRIEAATYIISALMTKSKLIVKGFDPGHLDSVLEKLVTMGASIERHEDGVTVLPSELVAADIETAPYPGFPTDVQAQMIALCTQVKGTSLITEQIFENRFMHVPELQRLGADITIKGNSAVVKGLAPLKGAPVMCTDLRASAALVLAAFCCEGETNIQRIYHLERGYENLEEKFQKLGAKIERVAE
jgi:UDP-N-acetylglucosamine 1-carboxyvinyltransferase